MSRGFPREGIKRIMTLILGLAIVVIYNNMNSTGV